MIYFDSCALVKLVWAEEHSADLELERFSQEAFVSSTLADIELRRTAWRVDPAGMDYVDTVLAELTLLPMDATVVRAAGRFAHWPGCAVASSSGYRGWPHNLVSADTSRVSSFLHGIHSLREEPGPGDGAVG